MEIVRWAIEHYRGSVTFVCSFQNCVLVDMAARLDLQADFVFLDTGFHFRETLGFVDLVRDRYGISVRTAHPGSHAVDWPCGTRDCCEYRKSAPLDEALRGRSAWVSGLKRVDTPERASAPIVGWDRRRGLAKISPLANWTDDDVDYYTTVNDLPVHPLVKEGYLSIGCAPVTTPVNLGESPRSGRWRGSGRTECGIHF